jgi:predicted ATPase
VNSKFKNKREKLMKNVFVIEGQAGAGKTPLIAEMKLILENKGYQVLTFAPFAYANQYVVDNGLLSKYPLGIYSCWSQSVETSLFAEELLQEYIEESINKAKDDNSIVLFDRGWLTICMGLLETPCEQEKIDRKIKDWIDKNMPTFFLDTMPNITQGRQSWNPILPWTNENIDLDFNRRRIYIKKHKNVLDSHTVLESRIDLTILAQSWVNKILKYRK